MDLDLSTGLDRRHFLVGGLSGALGLMLDGPTMGGPLTSIACCPGGDPLDCIRRHNYATLAAYAEAQLFSLWDGPPADSAAAVADDMIRFMGHLDVSLQRGACGLLLWIRIYSLERAGRPFPRLTPFERTVLLNQGEVPKQAPWGLPGRAPPVITWEGEYVFHTAISVLALIAHLVIHSRAPARKLVGLSWSAPCRDPANLVRIEPPPYPDLSQTYDVCVVGSGAGGALVAARAAERGKRVLLVESGKWISPDALVEYRRDGQGNVEVLPPRSDRVLMEAYRDGGVQIAGGLGELLDNKIDVILPWRRRRIAPQQAIDVLQAHVVGGGPYVNNAIHLEIREETYRRWGERQPQSLTYHQLWQRMQEIKRDLGVNQIATNHCAGLRSVKFVEGCLNVGEEVQPTPVSILPHCFGCGADNAIDPFGEHTGGLHPYRPSGPNSYLMQALTATPPARVAYEMRAHQFHFRQDRYGQIAADHLVVEDRRGRRNGQHGGRLVVRAHQFVLAAGAVASTNILRQSLATCRLCAEGLGERLTANVGVPLYALYDNPIVTGEDGERPEPGIAQCFMVDRKTRVVGGREEVVEPDLENWFHFPGTVALGVTGWFQQHAQIMRKYNHLSISGLFVATKVRPQNRIRPDGRIELDLDDEEFDLLVRGLERIGRIYLSTATADNGVTLFLPTKAVLTDPSGCPLAIRSLPQLEWALGEVRRRGAAFVNLLTSHPQGGNSLGSVVDRSTFRLRLADGRQVENLYVADASIFPAGCEINPQLTVAALASFAADAMG